MANRYRLWVRLVGEPTLPPTKDLVTLLGVEPTTDWRRGGPLLGKPIQGRKSPMRLKDWGDRQEVDVWTVELVESWKTSPDPIKMAHAVRTLERMAQGLAALDRTRCRAELYVSATCFEAMGSFGLPAAILATAGAAQLELVVSIFCAVYDDGNGEEESKGGGEEDDNKYGESLRGDPEEGSYTSHDT